MQIELKNIFRTNRILQKNHEIFDYLELTRKLSMQPWIGFQSLEVENNRKMPFRLSDLSEGGL